MRHHASALLTTTRHSSQEEVSTLPKPNPDTRNGDMSRTPDNTFNILYVHVGDDTLKLWDIRSFKRPVNVVTGLDNIFAGTDCVFSPDEQTIMTGVSVKKGEVRKTVK